ncbi:MAG: flagellar basal body rod C-terminal domain-containing protein [Alphaproteobacteria bacterium]
MSNALSIAVNGLNSAASLAVKSATNIVNSSSTGNNVDGALVTLSSASTDYAANAAVIKTVDKMNKALLDITV